MDARNVERIVKSMVLHMGFFHNSEHGLSMKPIADPMQFYLKRPLQQMSSPSKPCQRRAINHTTDLLASICVSLPKLSEPFSLSHDSQLTGPLQSLISE